jgi:peptidoglycan/xylan/chitin deacetylase (PgdA/CDA1 family)
MPGLLFIWSVAVVIEVTLTFDNGPEPEVTPLVLEVLARRKISATFFVLGRKLATPEGRKIAERAHAEGHWLGNHTWSHTTPLGLLDDPRAPEREIGRTQSELGVLAHPQRYFRPFGQGGQLDRRLLNPPAVDFLVAGGFTCVLWNAVPRDWEDPDGWVERALDQVRARTWSLLVLHDLPTGAMRHLDRFIEAVTAEGQFRQDFPADCIPILGGRIVRPLADYVST